MSVSVTLRFREVIIDGKTVLIPDPATAQALEGLVTHQTAVLPIKKRGPGRPPKAKVAGKRGPGRPPKK